MNTVPTVRMKNGDFGEVSQLIYDPATTVGNTRTPFPGNQIPQSRFSQISRNLLPAIPNPARASVTSNFDFINLQPYDRYIYSIKFDHAITANNRLAFLVTKEQQMTDDWSQLPGALGQGLLQYQRPDNWRINHDLVVRPDNTAAHDIRLLPHAPILEQSVPVRSSVAFWIPRHQRRRRRHASSDVPRR